ncbi:HAD family hydrolase [Marinifilum sp. JC120]|nr:HAD family hydrolase [Marinifilum sp. JC120]
MNNINVVAFDADDTLWINEPIFQEVTAEFCNMFPTYNEPDIICKMLEETQSRTIPIMGYGSKPFVIAMIETAIQITGGHDCAKEINRIIEIGKEMQSHPVELLDGVEDVLDKLAADFKLMLITKGDLMEQERKIQRSGLADYFSCIEIVSEKDERTYKKCLDFHDICKDEFVMVGNSVKSDVLPVVNIGSNAVHIPFHTTWCHECVDESALRGKDYITMEHAKELIPALLAQ